MRSNLNLYLLLLLPAVHSIHIPFYCKIRKTNCQLRPESTCCQHLTANTTTTAATTISTTGDTTDVGVGATDIPKLNNSESILSSAKEEEILKAEPSEIDEVYVKVSGESIESNFIISTAKPEKYAPRFCLKLKFNCKLRSTHACCKYPLPPRDENHGSTTSNPKAVKLPVRPTRIQIAPVTNNVSKIKRRKSPFRRPLRTQQNDIEKLNDKDSIGKKNSKTDSNPVESKRKEPIRPVLNSVRNSSVKRRRPAYFSNNKSPVCRIINCKRNKNHKCCQKPTEKTTTVRSSTITSTGVYEETQDVEINIHDQKDKDVEFNLHDQKEKDVKINKHDQKDRETEHHTELDKENFIQTESLTSTTTSIPIDFIKSEMVMNLTHYQAGEMESVEEPSNVTYNTESQTTTPLDTSSHKDTTMMAEYDTTRVIETDQAGLTSNMQNEKTSVEDQLEPDENLDFQSDSQYSNTSQPMASEMIQMHKQSMENNETGEEEQVNVREKETLPIYNISTEQSETNAEYETDKYDPLIENVKSERPDLSYSIGPIKPVIAVEEIVLAEYPAYVSDYSDYIIYEDEGSVETKQTIETDLTPAVQHNNIDQETLGQETLEQETLDQETLDQETLDLNQILPRVSVECFRFDCLSEPDHECCYPHKTPKREIQPVARDQKESLKHKVRNHSKHNNINVKVQPVASGEKEVMEKIMEDHPGRVTATVTRVQKTVRW